MAQERLPRSQRKFIRKEKARIRREILDSKKQEEMIQQLYKRFTPISPRETEVIKLKQRVSAEPTN